MSILTERKTDKTVSTHGFSSMEKWVLAALATLPLSSLVLITDGFHGLASHWL